MQRVQPRWITALPDAEDGKWLCCIVEKQKLARQQSAMTFRLCTTDASCRGQLLHSTNLAQAETVGGHSDSKGRIQNIQIAVRLFGLGRTPELGVRKGSQKAEMQD